MGERRRGESEWLKRGGEGMSGKERGGVGAREEWRKEEGREGRDGEGEEEGEEWKSFSTVDRNTFPL